MSQWKWKQRISKDIFNMKYNLHNENSIEEIFNNISQEIASCETINKDKIKNEFYEEMISGKFIPAGRILANARPNSKMKNYNNCFTIAIDDSMESIYNALKEDALISKMGGGVGFNISHLRPRDAIITKGGESSGPISFLKVFDASAKTIHTGGGRRSAHIAIMNIDHPDIEEFITVKQGDKNKALTQFNISVGITDAFIDCYKKDGDWDLKFNDKVYKTVKARDLYNKLVQNAYMHNEPGIFNLDHVNDNSNAYYMYYIEQVNPCVTGDTLVLTPNGYIKAELLNEGDEIITKNNTIGKIKTKEINYDMSVKQYLFESGLLIKVTDSHTFFINGEKIRADCLKIGDILDGFKFKHKLINIINITGLYTVYDFFEETTDSWITEDIISLGCGEQSLPVYGVCDLGAINFSKFVINAFTDSASVLWDELSSTIKTGIRFLDNVLSTTEYPLDKIQDRSLKERRIGLGFTGYADMLAKMRIKYGSQESIDFTEKLASFFRNESYKASIELAKEKGSFPVLDREKFIESGFCKRLPDQIRNDILQYGIRNICTMTIAPTGTTSLSLGNNCSSGIEPMFSLSYTRNYRIGKGEETASEVVYDDAWLEYVEQFAEANEAKKILSNESLKIKVPDYFVTTIDIDAKPSIDIQAIWQKYIDASISKTLNLKPGTTFEEYKDLFLYAYDKGLKGFTSFNSDGSVKGILEYNIPKKEDQVTRHTAPKRPEELLCDIHEVSLSGKKFLVLVGKLDGSLYEIFVDDNSENAVDVDHHKEGVIKKNGKGTYSLIVKNGSERVVVQNLAKSFDQTYGVLARFVSMALRHGTPLQFIVEQLQKSKHFTSFEKVVARILKKYIKDGEVSIGNKCPECGDNLHFQEGCLQCMCGYSKCS